MDINNFQRVGVISNSHAGRDFEDIARLFFGAQGIILSPAFGVPLGVGSYKKVHKFDFGSEEPALIVECKSHRWTQGKNMPSAKITVWNEAMYYFHLAPAKYRKVFFVLKDVSGSTSLASYYVRNYAHLIPKDVELWEYDESAKQAIRLDIRH